jgi:hypothetical protein
MFDDGDDKEGGIVFQVDALDGVRVAVFLEEREKSFGNVLNIIGEDILKGVDTDEIVKVGNKEPMVGEDEFETIIPGFMNRHGITSIPSIWVGDVPCFND